MEKDIGSESCSIVSRTSAEWSGDASQPSTAAKTQSPPPQATSTEKAIRTYWEVPAIAHFCSLFRAIFKLIDFDIEDLEEGFIVDTEAAESGGRSSLIVDLLIALLKGCTGRKDCSLLNYNQILHDLLSYRWEYLGLGANPLGPERDLANFHRLPLFPKIKLLHFLCEWRLERPDVEPLTKNLDGDSLRVNALGRDEAGATYWYFYGTRLFKEDPEPVKITLPAPKKKNSNKKSAKGGKAKKAQKRKKRTSAGQTRKSARQAKRRRKDEQTPSFPENSDSDSHPAPSSSKAEAVPVKETKDGREMEKRPLRLKPKLLSESGRSSPATSDVDGMVWNENIKEMITRIYSRDEDESSVCPSVLDEDSRMSAGIEADDAKRSDQIQTKQGLSTTVKEEEVTGGVDESEKMDEQTTIRQEADVKKEDEFVEEADGGVPLPVFWDQDLLYPDQSQTKRWQLICQTMDDWNELADKMDKSRSKHDRELHKLIVDEFLPEMDTMFKEKAKEEERKMSELCRRSSDRLEVKRLQREAEQKKLTAREAAEIQRVEKLEDQKKVRVEAEQREQRARIRDLERQRQQRLKERARDERARRLELRQRRQELLAAGAEIPEEMLEEGGYLDDEELNELDIEIEFEHMYGQLEKVLDVVKRSEDSEAFLHPVTEAIAPKYFEIISKPMDFEAMETKLLEREYKNKLEFIDDMNLIFLNCLTYNGWKNDYTKLAQKIERTLIKAWKKYFPPPMDAEDDERARRDEWACVNRLGALDRKIKELLQPPPKPTPEPRTRSESRTLATPQSLRTDATIQRSGRLSSYLEFAGRDRSAGSRFESATMAGRAREPPSIRRPTFSDGFRRNMAPPLSSPRSRELPTRPTTLSSRSLFAPPATTSVRPLTSTRPSSFYSRPSYIPRVTTPQGSLSKPPMQQLRPKVSEKPTVYLLQTPDGNRMLKFVTKSGQPAPQSLVTQVLPQIRKEAHRLPKGVVTLTLDASQATFDPAAQSTDRDDFEPSSSRQRSPGPIFSPAKTISNLEQSGDASKQRFYHIGENNYLGIEQGNPYLYVRKQDGSFERKHQVGREALMNKLRDLKEQRAESMAKPVCSVAPQPQLPPPPAAVTPRPRVLLKQTTPSMQRSHIILAGSSPTTYVLAGGAGAPSSPTVYVQPSSSVQRQPVQVIQFVQPQIVLSPSSGSSDTRNVLIANRSAQTAASTTIANVTTRNSFSSSL